MDIIIELYRGLINPMEDFGYPTDQIYLDLVADTQRMHELTGDFYTVGQILGHSLKGIGIQLGISTNLEAVTAQYVNVRADRKLLVLETYHQAVLG